MKYKLSEFMGRAKRKADWRHVLPISVCLTARRWVQKQDIYIYIPNAIQAWKHCINFILIYFLIINENNHDGQSI